MPTFNNTDEMVAYFSFNHVISRFGVPQVIVKNHEKNSWNHMMTKIAAKLEFSLENFTPYYPLLRLTNKLRRLKMFLILCFNV